MSDKQTQDGSQGNENRWQILADATLAFILAARWWILGSILILTVIAARIVFSTEFASSLAKSFVDSEDEYQRAFDLEGWFEGNPDSLVYVGADEGDAIWESRKLLAIRRASEQIGALAEVRDVWTIADIPTVDLASSGIRAVTRRSALLAHLKEGKLPDRLPKVEPLLPTRISDRKDWSEDKLDLLTQWIASRNTSPNPLLSKDGQAHLMLIEIEAMHEQPPEVQMRLYREIQAILNAEGIGQNGLYLSGLLALQAASLEQIDTTLFKLLPLGAVVVGVMVYILFRRFEPIVMIGIIAAVSVLWGIGFGDWLYGSFSVLVMAVPLMVVVISTGDIIHLISAYCADLNKGHSHEVALRKTFREMSSACTLTSLTTFIGFSSLGLVPSQTIRQFGISAAVGVAGALVLSVILVPIFINMLHSVGWTLRLGGSNSKTTHRIAWAMAKFGTRFPLAITIVFACLLVGALFYSSRVTLDPDIYRRFRASNPIAQGTEFFIERFGSVSTIEIVVEGDSDQMLQPETFRELMRLSSWYEENLNVDRVDSVATIVHELARRIDPKNKEGIPESAKHTEGILRLLQKTDPRAAASLITPDFRALRIVAHVPATSYLSQRALMSSINTKAREVLPESLTIHEKGSAPLIGNAVKEIIKGHMYGFVVSFMMILLLISIGLRSLRMGLIAVPTNLIPLISLGGIVGITGGLADSDVLGVATLGLGLAVDDTIHFLSRYRRELRAERDVMKAIEGTVHHTGVAIVRTTTILTIGFLPFAASDYWSINMLGTYLVVILIIALLADLLLLPALVKLFGPRPIAK